MQDASGRGQGGELARAWTRVRAHLRDSAGARLFDQWLKPMELVDGGEADVVRLTLPSPFMTNWVRNHYADRLLHEFRAQLPHIRAVAIETAARITPAVIAAPLPPVAPAAAIAAPPVASMAAVTATARIAVERPVLDARFTFDRFVVDASNKVAFNAARALAEPGVPRFSPLFLHSGTGQGKTHLMHAIGHAFQQACPDRTILAMSAERFMFDFVAALRGARHPRVQGAAAFGGPAADRRPSVHRRQGFDAGGVLPHDQRDHGRRQAAGDLGRSLPAGAGWGRAAHPGTAGRRTGRRHQGPRPAAAPRDPGPQAGRPARRAGAGRRAGAARTTHPCQHPRAGRRAQPGCRLCAADRRVDRSGVRDRDARRGTARRAEAGYDRRDPEAGVAAFRAEAARPRVRAARAGGGAAAADRDVPRQAADHPLAARDRGASSAGATIPR